jgi:predicted component of type VI protein secretion system
MQVVLVMFRADGERRSFSIVRDMTVIGRREDCDLRIPLGEVSRKHCRMIKDGDTVRLEDLGSSNGTFHNGQRVQEAVLAPGDNVQVGPVSFVVQIDGQPADDELQPPIKETAQQAMGDFLPVEEGSEPTPESIAELDGEPGPAPQIEPDVDQLAGAPEGSDFNVDVDDAHPAAGPDDMVEFNLDEQHSSEDRPA